MKVKQFEYKPLAHYSYALESEGKVAIIDPERDPAQYLAFAEEHDAAIVAIIETHPHADFVSGHLELHKATGATIYNSRELGASYPHKAFDQGDKISLGSIELEAMNTPGHSPDSITVIARDGNDTVLFTGDTVFIGDVGRPDLRENAGNTTSKRRELAAMMYDTITTQFTHLPDDAVVYPAHGAGSLCGKNMSDAASSTLGDERRNNWAFQQQSKEEFMATILEGQPFIPSYFGYNVDLNKSGTGDVNPAIDKIPFVMNTMATGVIVDMRDESHFKKGHLKGSFNIQAVSQNAKFETWLGSIVEPTESFTLVIDRKENNKALLHRVAKIGYEKLLNQVITLPDEKLPSSEVLDLEHFKNHPESYTIVDIRNASEVEEGKFFDHAISLPLNDLRNTAGDLSINRPIVAHCAGGYRSAAGASIIKAVLPEATVYDLSDHVKQFQ
ncbi:MAG: MBL fold metallo-hydrolase [Nonlabens sp.]